MSKLEQFIRIIESEFPNDRLTSQKMIPTFHPESAEEAARLFELANKEVVRLFITGYGNSIDPAGERFSDILAVRTDRLNKLIKIAAEDFYVTVGAGYPLREINMHLAKENLWFPHAALPYVGSVGGALAVGLSAQLDGHQLPIKKYFIKAQVVTPKGEIISPGSVCFKSVSGYDIVKIFSPSWGLLGLIVSVSFRVMPQSASEEFASMIMEAVNRKGLLASLDEANKSTDADYARKIKAKFDPQSILPVM